MLGFYWRKLAKKLDTIDHPGGMHNYVLIMIQRSQTFVTNKKYATLCGDFAQFNLYKFY